MTTLYMEPVVYGQATTISTPHGAFREMVAPGALSVALKRSERRTMALRDHDPGRVLGRVASGTLVLSDGPTALRARISLPDTEVGHDTAELVRRGDLSGGSFSFVAIDDEWRDPEEGDSIPTRVIRAVTDLWDVSVCSYPAYEGTSVYLAGSSRSAQWRRIDERVEELRRVVARDRLALLGRPASKPWWGPATGVVARRGCGHGLRQGEAMAFGLNAGLVSLPEVAPASMGAAATA